MPFIIVEFNAGVEYASIVTNEDGDNLVFRKRAKAEEAVEEYCNDAIVVEIKPKRKIKKKLVS